ncbi:unnamed protein product [Phytophthora fragariaefolia]|uniref:Unnamed protein product n=1 Tax=Phytophthora fragariaefolia TaxID=1490495 RepID=A0A9W6XZ80_9STRA|nr:unnamed protein product [Phytophthora fragariaefolia]
MRPKPYRSLIGCLLSITTRSLPGIAFVVTQLSRFLGNPEQQHWSAAVRVLRYLKWTRQHGIIYQRGTSSGTLKAYSDVDWGTNIDDRRFRLGCHGDDRERPGGVRVQVPEDGCAQLCRNRVHGFEPGCSRSAMDSCDAQGHGSSLAERYDDLGGNQGAIALAQNAGYDARTKHVDIRHHFIRENVEPGMVKVEYVDTKNQLADILTKALGTQTLKFLRNGNGIKNKVTVPQRWRIGPDQPAASSFENLQDDTHSVEPWVSPSPSLPRTDIDIPHLWRQPKAAGWLSRHPTRFQNEWRYTTLYGTNVLIGGAVVTYALTSGLFAKDADDRNKEDGTDEVDKNAGSDNAENNSTTRTNVVGTCAAGESVSARASVDESVELLLCLMTMHIRPRLTRANEDESYQPPPAASRLHAKINVNFLRDDGNPDDYGDYENLSSGDSDSATVVDDDEDSETERG